MARVELYLEDKDGSVSLAIRHIGGFDAQSPAHRMANQLVLYLDHHADWKKDEIVEMADPSAPLLTTQRPGVIHLH